jgi:signal peptidase I
MIMMKIFIKIVRSLALMLLSVLLLLNVIFIVLGIISGTDVPLFLGYGRAVVVTGSMEPVIAPGDMVIIHEQDTYEVDDIVIYKADNYIAHRIIAVTENGFITKGDANNVEDDEILREQVVGKVIRIIPKIGVVVGFLKSPFGILVTVIGVLALIEVPEMIRRLKKK